MRRPASTESHISRREDGRSATHRVWGAISTLATRQHGVISRVQLLGFGLTSEEIDNAIAAKRLHPVHAGVYAVGHRALTRHGRYMAAVLSAGDGAVLSHRSAAGLWELRATREREIDVIATTHRRGDDDVIVHRTTIADADRTTCQGIPVTTALRTILDLAAVLREHQLEPAIRQAVYRDLTTTTLLAEAVHNRPGQRGTRRLRNALIHLGEAPGPTRSPLEDRFLRFLRRHKLPMPELNAAMEIAGRPIEADCLWRKQKVIIELDGRDAHDSTPAFEADRARDLALAAAGWTPGRVTSARMRDGSTLAAELRALLV